MSNFDAEPAISAELQNGDSFVETGSNWSLFVVRKGDQEIAQVSYAVADGEACSHVHLTAEAAAAWWSNAKLPTAKHKRSSGAGRWNVERQG